jgi:bifunctional non-homologous end joining protein LigD
MSVKRSALPLVKPGLAKLVDETPQGPGWIHEMKYDGYRIMSYIEAGKVTLRTRNDLDWTSRFQNIADELKGLGKKATILDGEMVVFDENGLSSFSALQKKLSDKSQTGFFYVVFDIPFFNGMDLRDRPLIERKKILQDVVQKLKKRHIRFSNHLTSHGTEAFQAACERKLEGLISKDAQSPYPVGRNGNWLKSKCRNEQEFLICGFTDPEGQREGFGSLLLGYWDKNDLIYCGRVGTGFDSKTLKSIMGKLKKRIIPKSIFKSSLSWKERRGAHYVRPELVAQIKFTEWTPDGHLRHPVFLGLRQDKSATEIHRAA